MAGIPRGYCQCGCGGKTNLAKQNDPEHGHVLGEPFRFLRGHGTPRLPGPEYVVDAAGCWIWQGTTNGAGYGTASAGGRAIGAHRLYYERYVGPIPLGEEIHHVCEVKLCVNPDHLEAVTHAENAWVMAQRRGPPHRKLEPEDVEAIRGAWAEWPSGKPGFFAPIARVLGVCPETVRRAALRLNFKDA